MDRKVLNVLQDYCKNTRLFIVAVSKMYGQDKPSDCTRAGRMNCVTFIYGDTMQLWKRMGIAMYCCAKTNYSMKNGTAEEYV